VWYTLITEIKTKFLFNFVGCYSFFFSNCCKLHYREQWGFLSSSSFRNTHIESSNLCLNFSYAHAFTLLSLCHFTTFPLNIFYLFSITSVNHLSGSVIVFQFASSCGFTNCLPAPCIVAFPDNLPKCSHWNVG